MIASDRIIERVMRMGIEHRNGVPLEELYDFASRQIAKEDMNRSRISPKFGNLQEWFTKCMQTASIAYAFVERNGSLEVLKFSEFPNPIKYQFVGWGLGSGDFPRLRELQ